GAISALSCRQLLAPQRRDPQLRRPLHGAHQHGEEDVRQYRALGIDDFILYLGRGGSPADTIAAMERFAREVMPLVEEGEAQAHRARTIRPSKAVRQPRRKAMMPETRYAKSGDVHTG